MTRFDAADPADRRSLFVDAIDAHRERGSAFLTIEVDRAILEDADGSDSGPDPDLGTPWIQFADGVVNLDCTDEELERLKELLSEFPAFGIDEISRPEDVEGNNVRVTARTDADRIAQFLDATLRRVYDLPEDYRAWVVDV